MTTLRQFLTLLPYALRSMVEEDAVKGETMGLTALVVTYDVHGGPACWVVSSGGAVMPTGYKPYSLVQTLALIDFADPSSVLGRPVNLADRTSFDPVTDGTALARAARLSPWAAPDGSERCCVAGFAELTSVSAEGVKRRTLCEWPGDRIGVPTKPHKTIKERLLSWRN